MSQITTLCPICKRPINKDEDMVACAVCGTKMHRRCVEEELLTDSAGEWLCPYDAVLAALDWVDAVLNQYAHALTPEQRDDIVERLKNYLKLLGEIPP
ncbi:MAG: hypothetical protein DRO12_04235 [Thermoprotei archaeon]|nr:MAG: hypothetical protein DRO12_04235 [Thermoprotei archaeon]